MDSDIPREFFDAILTVIAKITDFFNALLLLIEA